MEDFTKFKLKSRNELTELLKSNDNFTILACKKCFKKFTLEGEPECDELVALIDSLGKNVSACLSVDFLCNSSRTARLLDEIELQGTVITVSCGLGVQTVGSLASMPVYTACDSVCVRPGQHSMSLADALCAGCGDCVLGDTFGICPVVNCAKGLLNGECGGAVDKKCEVDKERDCAWVQINERRVASAGSVKPTDLLRIRSFSSSRPGSSQKISSEIFKKRLDGFYGGVYSNDCKEFSDSIPLIDFPVSPRSVTIPMSQHKGMSADPIVSVGDHVKVGQKIGEASGTLSSSIHSSVSGYVAAISSCNHPNSSPDTLEITIESDGKSELHNSVRPIGYWEDLDIFDIDAIIAEKGIVGMGGAGFPTPIKLKSQIPIETILINGCESEPYITADHRVMLEYTKEILEGLKIILKSTEAKRAIIVITENKPDAIERFRDITSEISNIEILPVPPKYPQGSERMLLQRVLGYELKPLQRPHDIGVIVLNVSTTKAIGDAFLYGMPLISRAVTVTGEKIKQPGNYMIPIGTSVFDILHFCGALDKDDNLSSDVAVTLGGPMMGSKTSDFSTPIIKGTHGILIQSYAESIANDCIRCGRCVDVCPISLLPLYFSSFAELGDCEKMNEYNISHCIECGCCDYICPSRIEIRQAIKSGKKMLS